MTFIGATAFRTYFGQVTCVGCCLWFSASAHPTDVVDDVADGRQFHNDRGVAVDVSSGSETESYVVDSDVEPDDVTDALPVTISTYVFRNIQSPT